MRILRDPAALAAEALQRRARGERVGFVPTMGFLHAGHTSLMDIARPRCDWLVTSIYVNPLQFGPTEDLDRYPRDPQGDAEKCAAHGVDVLFMPDTLYAPDHSTTVKVGGLQAVLCGAKRPGHFDGVTTVVARLFGVVQPNLAVFGEKDFQQLAVIRRMVRDLAMGVEVIGGPLVRDADGLALSSRNAYLSPEQRRRALSLSRALRAMAAAAGEGAAAPEALLALGASLLDVDALDYLELRDPDTLETYLGGPGPVRAFVAARLGPTRLIDNLAIERTA
jgi:pantoate--beta-alanine ligase